MTRILEETSGNTMKGFISTREQECRIQESEFRIVCIGMLISEFRFPGSVAGGIL